MASSTCPKCDSHSFELREAIPTGSAYKLSFVQCSSCGAVVGVMDYWNIGSLMEKQNAAIKAIADKIGASVSL